MLMHRLTSRGSPYNSSSSLENPVKFLPAKIDLPSESLTRTRALEYLRVSAENVYQDAKVLTRGHDIQR